MTVHHAQRHWPKYVREMLLPGGHPFALYAHADGNKRGLVPFEQNQIGPPGIVPAGRIENLVQFGGMDEAFSGEVGAGEKPGLLGVVPVGGFGKAVEHCVEL